IHSQGEKHPATLAFKQYEIDFWVLVNSVHNHIEPHTAEVDVLGLLQKFNMLQFQSHARELQTLGNEYTERETGYFFRQSWKPDEEEETKCCQ
ncbi:hypothetical protein E2320_001482, partial [Naja naja]